jgi:hypothetical protein
MPITLTPDARKQLVASIRRYAAENLDEEIGDLKAGPRSARSSTTLARLRVRTTRLAPPR